MVLVILDRDGVINQDSDQYIKSPEEWIPIPGSLEAIARLNHAGFLVAVATNQSGLARGLIDLDTLNAMHAKMREQLARVGGHVDGIFFCPHGPDDGCNCRKPEPGLYRQISERCAIDLRGVAIIGDSRRDLEAAQSVGARPILVRTGKGDRSRSKLKGLGKVEIFDDLAATAAALIAETSA